MTDRTARITVALCMAVALLEGIDLQAAGVAAPRLAPAFGLGPETLSLFFAASTFGMIFGAFAGGWLSDRVGRKAVLVWSVASFGLFMVLTAAVPSAGWLIALRTLTGVGLGSAMPCLIAIAAESNPAGRGRAVAMMYAGMPLGGAIAAAVSLYPAGWQAVFVAGGFLPLLIVPLLAVALPANDRPSPEGDAEATGIASGLFGGGRAMPTLLLWLAFVSTLLVLYLLLNWLPSLLTARGFDRAEVALAQMLFNLAGATACLTLGRLFDGARLLPVAALVYGGVAAGLGLLSTAATGSRVALLYAALVGAAILSAQALLFALAPRIYPARWRGAGVGATVAVGRVGSIVGPLLAGMLLAGGRSPAQVLTSLFPIVAVALLATAALIARRL